MARPPAAERCAGHGPRLAPDTCTALKGRQFTRLVKPSHHVHVHIEGGWKPGLEERAEGACFQRGERSSQRTGGDGGFALGEVCPHLLRAHCWVFQRCEDLIEHSQSSSVTDSLSGFPCSLKCVRPPKPALMVLLLTIRHTHACVLSRLVVPDSL